MDVHLFCTGSSRYINSGVHQLANTNARTRFNRHHSSDPFAKSHPMTSAGVATFILLLLGSVVVFAMALLLTAIANAFIGTPDDLNDVDIDGTPKRK